MDSCLGSRGPPILNSEMKMENISGRSRLLLRSSSVSPTVPSSCSMLFLPGPAFPLSSPRMGCPRGTFILRACHCRSPSQHTLISQLLRQACINFSAGASTCTVRLHWHFTPCHRPSVSTKKKKGRRKKIIMLGSVPMFRKI
uniref:Uncharacterized protein n=1 Tax=Aegilops tauschii subsp. strangulata TaxID=200361 RepID=A0A453F1I1_AEGTS